MDDDHRYLIIAEAAQGLYAFKSSALSIGSDYRFRVKCGALVSLMPSLDAFVESEVPTSLSPRNLLTYCIVGDSSVNLITSPEECARASAPVHAYIDCRRDPNSRRESRDYSISLFIQNYFSVCDYTEITDWSRSYHTNVFLPKGSDPRTFKAGDPVLCYLYTEPKSLFLRVAKIAHCGLTYRMLDTNEIEKIDQLTSSAALDEVSCQTICSLGEHNVFVGLTPSFSGIPCIDPAKEFVYFQHSNPVSWKVPPLNHRGPHEEIRKVLCSGSGKRNRRSGPEENASYHQVS